MELRRSLGASCPIGPCVHRFTVSPGHLVACQLSVCSPQRVIRVNRSRSGPRVVWRPGVGEDFGALKTEWFTCHLSDASGGANVPLM